jgi:hypothetical protein
MSIQKMITLSDRSGQEYAELAEWKGMPMAKLLNQILETYHQSEEFSELIKRVRGNYDEPRKPIPDEHRRQEDVTVDSKDGNSISLGSAMDSDD